MIGGHFESEVTDIAPVPSQSEWAALKSALTTKDEAIEAVVRAYAENDDIPDLATQWMFASDCRTALQARKGTMTIEEALKKLAKLQLKDGYILGLVPDVVIGNSRASRWCVYAVNLWSKVPDSLISSGATPMEAIALAVEALSDARYCSIPVIPIRLYTEHGE